MFEVNANQRIYDLMNWAQGRRSGTRYPGMSYEQGILDALMWPRRVLRSRNPMDG